MGDWLKRCDVGVNVRVSVQLVVDGNQYKVLVVSHTHLYLSGARAFLDHGQAARRVCLKALFSSDTSQCDIIRARHRKNAVVAKS